MVDNKLTIESVIIDTERIDRLLKKIILREKTNLKTREKTDAQMVQMIKKMIEEEVECY